MNPIDYATLCVVGMLYILYAKGFKKFLGLLLFFPLLLFLVINLPRAYLLALFFSPLFYFIIRRGKAALLMAVILGGALTSTVFLAANTELFMVPETQAIKGDAVNGLDRLTDTTLWKQSLYGRSLHFKNGLNEFFKSPIIGQGMKTGKSKYSWQHSFFTWHNFNIEWLVFGGIIGYLLYSGVLIANFITAGKHARQDHMTAASLVTITLILINSITNGIMHGMMPYAIFLLLGFIESRTRDLTMQSTPDNEDFLSSNSLWT
nr:hypothetical protein [Desulfobulbaceae bacterium]